MQRPFFWMFGLALLLGCTVTAPAASAQPKPIKSGEHYQIYGVLQEQKLVLEIVPTDGWKLNLKAPLKLRLTASGEVKVPRELWSSKDASRWEEKRCRLEIPLLGPRRGVLTLQLDFVICTEMLCQKKKFSFDYSLPSE